MNEKINFANPYDAFASNASLEEEGIWESLGMFEWRLARSGFTMSSGGNKRFAKIYSKHFARIPKGLKKDTKEKVLRELNCRVLAEACITDGRVYNPDYDPEKGNEEFYENSLLVEAVDDDGEPILGQDGLPQFDVVKFDHNIVADILIKYPNLYERCLSVTELMSNYRDQEKEDILGN